MAKASKAEKVMTGVGITAAVAATAAGAYFLYGTEKGKKQRRKLSSWTLKMKKDMTSQLAKLKEVNEEAYKQVVDTVTKKYAKLKEVDPAEVAMMAKELKDHWKNIKSEFQASRKTVKKMTKKPAAKSAAKKAPKKRG